MTNQHEGAHARVFRGIHPDRKVVQLRKRDNLHQFIHVASHNTNGENVKMNIPLDFVNKAQVDDPVATVYSVVYATVAPSSTHSTHAATHVSQAATTQNADEAAYASMQSAAQATATAKSTAYPTRQFAPVEPSSTGIPDPMAAMSSTSSVAAVSAATASALGGTPLANQGSHATNGAAVSTSSAADSNNGMTGGAKAGVAFAVILALGMLAGLAFFCWRRRKNPKSQEEITNEKFNEKSVFPAPPKINRFSADSNRSSNAAATAPRLSLRPVTQFLPNLGDKRQSSSAWERPQNKNPFDDAPAMSEKQADPFAEGDGTDRTNSMSSTNSSDSKTMAAGGAASARGPNNVHRVQLDFKPSMEDELELISGQLVRMLHEYDDGWALCIRMDRTQQGVVPRTCLSKLPVKPRGPPQNRPQGPPSGRTSPPSANGMAPTPLTPSRERSGTIEAVPARKPVPGQAL